MSGALAAFLMLVAGMVFLCAALLWADARPSDRGGDDD